MAYYSAVFLIIALVAGALGLVQSIGTVTQTARTMFRVFLIVALITLGVDAIV